MVAVVFPGQGSQSVGMGEDLYTHSPAAKAVFDAVEAATGRNLTELCFELDEATLRQTQNAQLALYTVGLAAYRSLAEAFGGAFVPSCFAGHSVGEYAALAASGVLSIEEGAKLVQKRGELMAASGSVRPGGMAAVLGLSVEDIHAVCGEASTATEVVVLANDNCPGQIVISGDKAAVERASALASEKGAKRVMALNVSGAFHSPLMDEPAQAMGVALRTAQFQNGAELPPVYSNVTTEPVQDATQWPDLLERQLRSPVLWTGSVQNMVRDGVTHFVECGSGQVLCGLIKRIDKAAHSHAVSDVISANEVVKNLTGGLV